MAKLIASRTTQYPMVSEFTFTVGDTMENSGGTEQSLGADGTFVIIPLPPGAVVTGGSVDTEVALSGGDGSAMTIAVGDSADPDRYLAAAGVTAAGSVPMVPTGYRGMGENVQMTVDSTGTYAAGTVSVKVTYVVADRQNEVQIS